MDSSNTIITIVRDLGPDKVMGICCEWTDLEMDTLMDNLILQGCVTARLSFPLARLSSNQN